MTFPSNRTKRYEHSLGTMELASNMLYSSLVNADKKTQDKLFEHLKKYIDIICKNMLSREANIIFPELSNIISSLNDTYKAQHPNGDKLISIHSLKDDYSFTDPALERFQWYAVQLIFFLRFL